MKKDYTFSVRVPTDLLARIDGVLKGGEIRTMFARTAIEAEIDRREHETPTQREASKLFSEPAQ